VIKNLKTY